MRVRDLADATPARRDRCVDFLRAFAIAMVVLGHWLAVMITFRDGRLGGEHVLAVLPWTHWLTWLFQVMGIFFLVGGYANSASWTSARSRGDSYADWLGSRADRLLRPTTVFIAVGVAVAATARLAGVDPGLVRLAAWVVAISLWFLAVYLVVVALTPAMLDAHRRWGLAVPAALTMAAAGFDALRLSTGVGYLGAANFLVVWLILPQLGFAWRDGTLTRPPARPWLLFLGGSAALVALTTIGPYPVSMVGVPGAEVQNTSPPTVALLSLSVAQTGLALLLAGPLRAWLRRQRVWMAVIAVNGGIMTLFLWHMVPVLVAALALYPTGIMPRPEIGSASWFAWRPVWVAICALVLGVLVAVFARFERPRRRESPATRSAARAVLGAGRTARRLAVVLALVGTAATSAGIIRLTVGGFQGAGPAGVPLAALMIYLTGLVAFWAARHVRTSLPAPHAAGHHE
ncbi:acyltransferase family protein [Streptomyces shenzhenensis]|uniref:acyltransferase family protein n=1 Tax=Streptomyces shenzhenensis TaxID=943815 RepID=UPI0033D90615